ncbi:MAG: hypothetical protein H6825_09030 [Planctomycetes bacterium]|nr:hypothetical protein [Planctomycetota bacterium]
MHSTEREFEPGRLAQRPAEALDERLRRVGSELAESLRAVLEGLPEAPLRSGELVRLLGVNRAVAGKLLGAAASHDPLEAMHLAPGPEPLRKLVRAAARKGVTGDVVERAQRAVREFDQLIKRDAGTRAELDALISAQLPGARERFELASKYAVHKGLSQLKGVLAEHWLGAAVVVPSADDPQRLDLTWLNGAVAIRRLRPGVTVRFSYRYHNSVEQPTDGAAVSPPSVVPLEEFCTNPPAQLVAQRVGDTVHYTLPDDVVGKHETVDMFVVDHHPSAMRRYGSGAERGRNSLFVEPAVPVASLVFDVVLHEDVFPESEPRLYVYDTGYDGIANVNDPQRDADRVDIAEHIEFLGRDMRRVHAPEVPRYADMLGHLCREFGWDPTRFRTWRTRIRYPVYGWQVCLSFEPGQAPGA